MGKQKYYFEIHTADQNKAGTDSNIFIIMHGEYGQSNEIRLNGYVNGNAFERNKVDKFDIEFNDNYGDIYRINLRSDCMYASSGWLCDYVKISRKPETDQRSVSTFNINKWFENKDSHNLLVTSGYNKNIYSQKTYIEEEGAKHYIAAGSKTSIKISKKVNISVDYNKINTTSIETSCKISIPIDVITADFEYAFKSSVEEAISKKLGTEDLYETSVEYDNSKLNSDVSLKEIWIKELYTFDAQMGDAGFNYEVPTLIRFVGFKNISTGEKITFNNIAD